MNISRFLRILFGSVFLVIPNGPLECGSPAPAFRAVLAPLPLSRQHSEFTSVLAATAKGQEKAGVAYGAGKSDTPVHRASSNVTVVETEVCGSSVMMLHPDNINLSGDCHKQIQQGC
jgi:hypothetical protein